MPLRRVSYTVFALGSSAYANFCQFGKKLDKLMAQLGAKQMYPVGTGDELTGQEQHFINWMQGAFKVLSVFRLITKIKPGYLKQFLNA